MPAIYCTSVARRQRPRTPIVTRSSLEESQGRRTKRIGERITLARDRNLNNKYRGCVNHDVWPRHTSTRRRSIKDLIADPREIDRGGGTKKYYRRVSPLIDHGAQPTFHSRLGQTARLYSDFSDRIYASLMNFARRPENSSRAASNLLNL